MQDFKFMFIPVIFFHSNNWQQIFLMEKYDQRNQSLTRVLGLSIL